MKKALLIGSVTVLAVILGFGTLCTWQTVWGMMGQGHGMGSGMMHHGEGMGSQYDREYEPRYQQPRRALEAEDARRILENHLRSTRNPNLKLGKIEDRGQLFEAKILRKDDSLVDRVLVDKNTGRIRSVY